MIINLLLFLYILVLPGYLFSKLLFNHLKTHERAGIALASTLFILPLINFVLIWLLNTTLTIVLVLISTSIINLILISLIFKQKIGFKFKFKLSIKQVLFILLCLVIFSIHFLNFQGPTKDYWSTYIVAGSMFMSNDKIEFTDINGNQLYDYELKNEIPENLIDQNSYGIITKDQRIGASIIYSLPYHIFGLAAFRIFNALFIVLAFLFLYSIINHIFKLKVLGLFGSLIIVLNPLLFYFNRLNANILSLALISLLLFLLIKEKTFFLAGVFYGILGGIRNITIIFLPAILIFILLESKNNKLKKLFYFILGVFILILPILMWKSFAFGSILAHPTQYEGLYGHRPVFEHNILGLEFSFNGMLNFPFYEKIVRTPHFPFPNFLTLPLLLLRSFGLLLSSLAIIGIYYLTKQKKNIGLLMLFLLFPFLFFLLFQENWEELKSSFLILLLPALSIFIIAGIAAIKNRLNKNIIKPVIAFTTIIIILIASVTFISSLNFEKDQRWYERFPHSLTNEINLNTLPEGSRLDWQFFYTDETKEEYQNQKQKYISPGIFPKLYNPISIKRFSFEKFKNNINKKQLTTLEVWNYIYG